ncbi:DUF389 domain-containing protein [Phytoactinopolyspora halotolerans]|uniref:DUF389 domain-containing protein n=1 Tax=Phytoactinopolyspora halotolerans TaxID=1981512 RepID=A0A6L9SEQ8_9ACTN|nr:DUF389 domain-containing protein [Phytoactinopolyspora halotolerans]NEE03726.1 DUF389 domain-containing protein [Phytoactinopolyspora halotolerans]
MLHVRLIAPARLTDSVVALADGSAAIVNVVTLRGAVSSPAGDLIEFDLVREGADAVLAELRRLGLGEAGTIAVNDIDLMISADADAAGRAVPGRSEDAVVWDELSARTGADAELSWSFLAFLTLATLLAGIGGVLDQPILIVGAMVLGPEFGAIASACFGVVRREWGRIASAGTTLLVGFVFAIAITAACALAGRLLGWVEPEVLGHRPLTGFFFHADRWSFVVAVLAGIAGILAITSEKSTSLVGVFISVATIPAAGNIALGLALSHWSEAGRSAIQLGVNLAGLTIAGILTLLVQRALWSRFGLRLPSLAQPTPSAPSSSPTDSAGR